VAVNESSGVTERGTLTPAATTSDVDEEDVDTTTTAGEDQLRPLMRHPRRRPRSTWR